MKKERYNTLISKTNERLLTYINFTTYCKKEFLEKNKEYGQTWLTYRPKSLLTRIWNKGLRVRSIQDKKEQLVEDSLVSEFDAMYNYSIIALIVLEEMISDKLNALSPLELEPEDGSFEEHYKNAAEKCFKLFKRKDHDYNGAWVQMNISGIVDEIMVKLQRVAKILKAEIPVEEIKRKASVEFMDIANYAIFGSALIKEVDIDPMV